MTETTAHAVKGPESASLGSCPHSVAEDGTACGVEVRMSTLPHAGLGLFALRRFEKMEVCSYTGTVLTTLEALRRPHKEYLMRLGPQIYIDAADDTRVLARYINDSRRCWNARFVKLPEHERADVVAIEGIKPGAEIFADYGKWYWAGSAEKPDKLPLKNVGTYCSF
eukprot:GEMP01028132.1.p3 GENE.GEMP01028132.1~~GEMP01028132.1.p3  ORF type:complete len:167 (+),score=36.79 GEMP01028132.1:620-1120(+)